MWQLLPYMSKAKIYIQFKKCAFRALTVRNTYFNRNEEARLRGDVDANRPRTQVLSASGSSGLRTLAKLPAKHLLLCMLKTSASTTTQCQLTGTLETEPSHIWWYKPWLIVICLPKMGGCSFNPILTVHQKLSPLI